MAIIETKILITLSEAECSALKQFLGAQSRGSYMEKGLTKEQAELCSEFWTLLPFDDDD